MSNNRTPQDWRGYFEPTLAGSMARAIRNVRSVPGVSVIQHNNGGRMFTGRSGVVPFMKDALGGYIAPGINFKSNFK